MIVWEFAVSQDDEADVLNTWVMLLLGVDATHISGCALRCTVSVFQHTKISNDSVRRKL